MKIICTIVITCFLSGCAYRTSESSVVESANNNNIVLSESHIKGKKYTSLGTISVEIRKTTIFNADPSEEMANELLKKKAKTLGADAVINVRYDSGIGLLTWGYIEATGIAVRFINE
jgi:hypothetical protein